MSEEKAKPFSIGYAMRTTTKYMRKAIDISIRKTYARMPEFTGDEAKSQEVFKTLGFLHGLKTLIDEYQNANPEIFKGN